jgi:hypothetical protein
MSYTTINKSTDYFNTKLYSGNGSTQAITGVGFQPDWCWFKGRNFADNHVSIDSVRGTNKAVYQDTTSAETTQTHYFTSFDSDGYTLGNSGIMNGSSKTYASWNWKANGAGVANTDGTITSTVSANTTSGFSIVKYTGTNSNSTIGHGLGAVPKMIIIKNINSGYEWCVYHDALAANENLQLNTTVAAAQSDVGDVWNSTAPTNTTFGVGGNKIYTNYQGENYIAYCFAEKTGYSKFGSYTGNGNADGPFIYTGFKPAFVMFKNTSSALFWQIHDTARDPFNEVQKRLAPNSSDQEGSGSIPIDFLSNGIKLRTTATTWNESGSNFIYMAFAEAPLVGTNNVPCTAR